VQLAGDVRDFALPEVFRLLKMSAKTGALKVNRGEHWGHVYFRHGEVYYAASSSSGPPLGERLVWAGELSSRELAAVLAEQKASEQPRLLGTLLKEKGLLSQESLERFVREQIEDAVFSLFGWPEAEFHFVNGLAPPVDDIVVSLDAEAVIMEGCRRCDEWQMFMERLVSLEKVPHLASATTAEQVTLRAREWAVVSFIDGRRDINTIIRDSGLDRFSTAKVIFSLASAGLVLIKDPTLELLGQRRALALRGPIDVYNLTLLTTLCDSDVTNHLRVETVGEEELEVHITAGVRDDEQGGTLIYFCQARTPQPVIRRMALETSGFALLVNINSADAVLASRSDVTLLQEMGDRPFVVATYASLADERVTEEQVRELLQLPARVPVSNCDLRDPHEAGAVVEALLALVP
jgi:hypothetical protein